MTKIQCFFNGVWYIALKRQTVFLCSYITHKSLGPLMYKDRWWWWGGGGWWRWWWHLSFSHNSKTTSWLDPRTQNKETTSCTERKSVRHLYYIYNIILILFLIYSHFHQYFMYFSDWGIWELIHTAEDQRDSLPVTVYVTFILTDSQQGAAQTHFNVLWALFILLFFYSAITCTACLWRQELNNFDILQIRFFRF